MTHHTGWHEPGDAVAATRHDGVEAPIRPVLDRRQGLRGRAGLVAVAVVAIAVVAAGIGMGGRGIGPAAVGSPSGSGSIPDAGGRSSASPGSSPRIVASAEPGCVPVDADDVPEVRLWSTAGDGEAVRGLAGPADGSPASLPTSAWPVPGEDDAVRLDRLAGLVLIPERQGCIQSASVEYLAVTDLGGAPVEVDLGKLETGDPTARLVFRSPPAGDWVFHVVTRYATGAPLDDGRAVLERFFRVTADDGVQPTPLVTPTVACRPRAGSAPLPGLSLVAGGQDPVPGVDPRSYPGDILHNGAVVTAGYSDPLVIAIDGDVCATSWTIEWLDPISGIGITDVVQDNPSESPYWVSQNRIDATGGPIGRTVVLATVHFGLRSVRQAAWEVAFTTPPKPAVTFIGPQGTEVAGASGCGSSWTFANGTAGYEWCPSYAIPEAMELLSVGRDQPVRIETPGWTITGWNVNCGRRSRESGVDFIVVGGCDLGGGGGAPAIFMPLPGRYVVLAGVSADRDGDRADVSYFVEVEVLP